MRILAQFILLCIIIMLPGCMGWKPPADQATFFGPPRLEVAAQRAMDSQHFERGDWPDEDWWTMFGSNELNHLVQDTLEGNPSLAAAKYRVNTAREQSIVTREPLFPILSFGGDQLVKYLSKNGLIHRLNPALSRFINWIGVDFSFVYELDVFQRYRNRYLAAVDRERTELAVSKDVEIILSTMLVQAYYGLKVNLYKQKLTEELLEIRKDLYALKTLLFREALLSDIPPAVQAQRVGETQKLLDTYNSDVLVSIHLVNILRGHEPDDPFEIDTLPLEPPQTTEIPETLSLELVSRRPDLIAAIWKTKALAHEVSAAIADFYPDINLRGLAGINAVGYENFFKQSSFTEHANPAFSLPVYTAGAIAANVRSFRAQYNTAVAEYNDLLLKSAQEVADTLVILKCAYSKYHTQLEIIDQADVVFSLAKLNYEKGIDNLLQVYQAQETLIERQLENAQLLFDQYWLIVSLVKALGGGYYHAEKQP